MRPLSLLSLLLVGLADGSVIGQLSTGFTDALSSNGLPGSVKSLGQLLGFAVVAIAARVVDWLLHSALVKRQARRQARRAKKAAPITESLHS